MNDRYTVKLARSGKRVEVRRDGTILFALLEAGIDVAYSCGLGNCGSCETRVLSGTPEHRDFVLSDEERSTGDSMMICCSASLGDELVLDL